MNYEGMACVQLEKATLVRKVQATTGPPSQCDYEGMVHKKLIYNCPITLNDVTNTHPDHAGLRGKMVRWRPACVDETYIKIPLDILRLNHTLALVGLHVFFMNGVPFHVTLSRNIQLVLVECVPVGTNKELANLLNKVLQIYQ